MGRREAHEDPQEGGGGRRKETTYTYETKWSDELISSSDFRKPEGHQNPASLPVQSQRWNATTVMLGAFTLSDSLVGEIDAWKPLTVTAEQAAAATIPGVESVRQSGGGFYAGADAASPQVGDVRIRFHVVAPTVVSLISKQVGEGFQPWTTSRGNTLEELALGTQSMEQMFTSAHDANTLLTWVLRVVGFIAMAIGLAMVFSPLTAIADVIPFVGSLVGAGVALFAGLVSIALSSFTIGMAWLFYRPLIGVPMLIVTAACLFMLIKAAKAKKGGATPQPG